MGALVLGAALVAGTGCGKVAEKASEKAIERAVDGDVDISDDGFKVEGDDGSSLEISASGSLPDGWPAEVPVPEDLNIVTSSGSATGDGRYFLVAGTTGLSGPSVLDFYKDILSDWEVVSESTTALDGTTITNAILRLDERSLTIGVNESDGSSDLSLGYGEGDGG